MIAVDASALTNALTDDGPAGAQARSELSRDPHWAAPDHLIVEVFSAIRSRWLGGKISDARAAQTLAALADLTLTLIPVTPLLGRMWELRGNVTGYDAAYLAVAEAMDCPLVTADARLSRVPELRCEIRVALPDR